MSAPIPRGAWDCHTHVFGPYDRFPLAPGRTYTPPEAHAAELKAHLDRIGVDNVVLVQASSYGVDDAAMLDAVRMLGDRARAVTVIDVEGVAGPPAVAESVRGIRLNLHTAGSPDLARARRIVAAATERVAGTDLHLQVFAAGEVIAAIAGELAAAERPVVLDHMGVALTGSPAEQEALLELVAQPRTWVKLSAPERMGVEPDSAVVRALVDAIATRAPDRIVWGSDWPHSQISHDPAVTHEGFRDVDDGARLQLLAGWLGPELFTAMLIDNPGRLYVG